MAITQKQIEQLTPGPKRVQRGCGDGLILVIEPSHKGGGKSFLARIRQKSGEIVKQIPLRLGVFGTRPGQLTLKEARQKWLEIRIWARSEGKSPLDYGKAQSPDSSEKTLQDAVDSFLLTKSQKLRETTLRDYRLKLENQALEAIRGDTPLTKLEWDNGGRAKIMEVKCKSRKEGAMTKPIEFNGFWRSALMKQ